MDKTQIAHDLAIIVVKARLKGFESEHDQLGLNDYSDQAVEDYNYAFKRIKEQLDD